MVPRFLGGAHGHQDIGLVDPRAGHQGVRLADALFVEEVRIRAVSHDDQGLGQLFAHLDAPLLIPVDDLHGHAHVQKLRSQVVADFAGAHDHDGGRLGAEDPQVPEELGQLVRGGGEVDFVPRPEDEIAGGNDGLSLPGHGADQHPDPDVPVQVRQGQAVQGGIGGEAVFYQLQPPLGEGFHLHGGGETEDPGNLPGGGPLGIDDHGQAQFLPHEAELLFIFRVADAGDGVADAQLFGHQAGEDV